MADNKRWFKVWNSILTDPSFLITSLDNIGRWVLLGALMSLHGKNGTLHIEEKSLRHILRIENDNVNDNIIPLKNVTLRRDENDNGKIIVIMKNWSKYQKDSTSYKRLKAWRNRQNDNGVRGEERRGEKEKEEKIIKNIYGSNSNISLTQLEHKKLFEQFDSKAQEYIDSLSYQIASTGRKYKSHYMTILNWHRRGYFRLKGEDKYL